jgi:hypothetical protein
MSKLKLSMLITTAVEAVVVLFVAPWLGVHILSLVGLSVSTDTVLSASGAGHHAALAFLDGLAAVGVYVLNVLAGLFAMMTVLLVVLLLLRAAGVDRADEEV